MCNPKPGLRCSTHAYTDLIKAKTAYENLKDFVHEKELSEGDKFANSEAGKKYHKELLNKAAILDKRQRQFDLTVVAKDDQTLAKHYEPVEPDSPSDPKHPKHDKKAWADYRAKVEAHHYLKQRYAEVKKWKEGDSRLSAAENQASKERYEALEATVQPSRDVGRYLASKAEDKALPARNADVIAMFDHLRNTPTGEGGRKLTSNEQKVYDHAVQLLEAGEEFTTAAKKQREASRFAAAKQNANSNNGKVEVAPLVDWELKTAKEQEAQRKREARARVLKEQQSRPTLAPLPPAPVLGQKKPTPTPPPAPVSSGLSSTTGKPLIKVGGEDRTPGGQVRPVRTPAPPVEAKPPTADPTPPVRPKLFARLFGRK